MERMVVVPGRPSSSQRERSPTFTLFRREDKPDLYCAVPDDRAMPTFLRGEKWAFVGRISETTALPARLSGGPSPIRRLPQRLLPVHGAPYQLQNRSPLIRPGVLRRVMCRDPFGSRMRWWTARAHGPEERGCRRVPPLILMLRSKRTRPPPIPPISRPPCKRRWRSWPTSTPTTMASGRSWALARSRGDQAALV